MYTREDVRCAEALVRRYGLMLALGLGLLLAAYAAAVFAGSQALMLVIAALAFWFAALEIVLWLRPAVQYRAFLREMEKGLRRECIGRIEEYSEDVRREDGVRVRTVQMRLEDGDTRLFYLNISKASDFPAAGRKVEIICFGRHVVDWRDAL